MSYARFGPDSDVYVYASAGWGFVCAACKRQPLEPGAVFPSETLCRTAQQMLDHLVEHVTMGHVVPEDCLRAIEQEAKEAAP